jgi:uncharacterized protein involved in exopolysaccharide biosynthesis
MNDNSRSENITDDPNAFLAKIAPHVQKLYASWKTIALINFIVAVLSVAILLLFVKNYYDSTVVILPNYGGNSMLGGFSSIAAVAGINIGESNPTAIYQKLIQSETVLEPVIYKKYSTIEFKMPVNLLEYFEIELDKTDATDPIYMQERDKYLQMVEMLIKESITTNLDRITNILSITVRTPERQLSSDVANSLILSLDQYVRTKRKSNAKDQRIYIEERTKQVKDSLDQTEELLKKFREQNRIINSPPLLLEQSRLLRTIEILQAIYIELTKQMEIVKLEEIKDSPIINIQEEAGIPIKKSGPSRMKYLIIVLFVSISFSSGWFMFKNILQLYYVRIRHLVNG